MTFQETAASLPNGFHDAELQRFEMDYVRRQLRFDLVVWIGDMDDRERRETYRPARVTLDNVGFFVIEPPDADYPWPKQAQSDSTPGKVSPAKVRARFRVHRPVPRSHGCTLES